MTTDHLQSAEKTLILLHPAVTTTPDAVESVLSTYAGEVHQYLLPNFLESFRELEDEYSGIHFVEPQPSECDRSVVALILKISNSLLPLDGVLRGMPLDKITKLQKKMFGFEERNGVLVKVENKIVKEAAPARAADQQNTFTDKAAVFESQGVAGDSKDDVLNAADDEETDFTKMYMVKCTENDISGTKLTRRKKACADCTCGLKELEEQELEERKKANRERIKNILLLSKDDLTEIDFTIKGKQVGGCGSCALGDAFRCDGCPYLGLPAFKPGEAISLSSIQDDLE